MKTKTRTRTRNVILQRAKHYTLNDVLHYMQENHIIIARTLHGFELWSSIDIPENIRAVFYANCDEVEEMIAKSDIRTCVNAELHRREWHHLEGNDYRCCICDRIAV